MGKLIDSILQPRKEGIIAKEKPSVIILSSPNDEVSSAVRYSSVERIADERGYRILNKRPILFGHDFNKSVKHSQSKSKEVTIWLESHGAPGWLFSKVGSAESEMDATQRFAFYLKDIEATTGQKINSIILSCCYSANEYYSKETSAYFVSPARLLSILMPGCNVMGFIGQNSSAKVTNVFRMLPSGKPEPVITHLESMAVLFKDGGSSELPKEALYCDHNCTPIFVTSACDIDATQLYQPSVAIATINGLSIADRVRAIGPSYGDWQQTSIYGALVSAPTDAAETDDAEIEVDGAAAAPELTLPSPLLRPISGHGEQHSFFRRNKPTAKMHHKDGAVATEDTLDHADLKSGFLNIKGIRTRTPPSLG